MDYPAPLGDLCWAPRNRMVQVLMLPQRSLVSKGLRHRRTQQLVGHLWNPQKHLGVTWAPELVPEDTGSPKSNGGPSARPLILQLTCHCRSVRNTEARGDLGRTGRALVALPRPQRVLVL